MTTLESKAVAECCKQRNFALAEVERLRVENEALSETVKALRGGKPAPRYCSYCGENTTVKDLTQHILACPKRPEARLCDALSAAESRCQRLEAEVARLREALANAEARNAMSCENPCGDCAGCQTANDCGGDAGALLTKGDDSNGNAAT